jgi:hypothetical protein
MTELERLIDTCSLAEVLVALDVICGDKADHLRTNWQDNTSARAWDKMRKTLQAAAELAHDRAI